MSDPSRQTSDPWRRFTLLDLLLLVPCFGFGFVLTRWAQEIARQAPEIPAPLEAPETYRMPAPWPADASTAELFLVGCVLAVILSGPVVLGSHWLLRGRRDAASMGEWLWLGAPSLVLACVVGAIVATSVGFAINSVFLAVMLLGALVTCSQAFWVVFLAWPIDRDDIACAWTDRFGGVASLLTWTLVFYVLALAIWS